MGHIVSTFSIVPLALVNVGYKFIYVDVGQNGHPFDVGAFKKSSLANSLETGEPHITSKFQPSGTDKSVPYLFVGYDAFLLNDDMMKPYKGAQLTKEQMIFNYRLSRARLIVENALGILANRFRTFMKPITFNLTKVVLACVMLYNFHNTKCSFRAFNLKMDRSTRRY